MSLNHIMHREIVYFYILIGLIIVLYNYDMPQYYIAFVIFDEWYMFFVPAIFLLFQ